MDIALASPRVLPQTAVECDAQQMPALSVIIPFYNRWDLVHARLAELHRFAPDNVEIILVNNGSTEQEWRRGYAMWSGMHRLPIVVVDLPENIGFGPGNNAGVEAASGDVLVFMNDDVQLYGDIFSDIMARLDTDKETLVCGRVVDWPSGWNEFTVKGERIMVPYAEGWLLATRYDWWNILGGFDPRYGLMDYDDVDLSVTAMSKGFVFSQLGTEKARHIGGCTASTVGVNRKEYTLKNQLLFVEKWYDALGKIVSRFCVTK